MKKFVLLTLMVGMMPFVANAQDDMYFSPKKDKAESKTEKLNKCPVYYSGINRDVDEYNRRNFNSYYQSIGDSTSDVIDFSGNVPDSVYVKSKADRNFGKYDGYNEDDDYSYYRRLHRFDDDFFWAYDPWFFDDPWYRSYYGYYGPYYSYTWGRPWRYGYYGYYGGWYNPWYYDYAGWYDPWFYDYGWGHPYWGTTVVYRPYNRGGVTGTANHGWVDNGRRGGIDTSRRGGVDTGLRNNGLSSYRGSNSTSSRNTDAYNRQTTRRSSDFSNYRRNNDSFTQQRVSDEFRRNDFNQSSSYRNNSSFESSSFNRGGGFSSGSSFGGGSRGGGFSGGGRSGGGGHVGGRR